MSFPEYYESPWKEWCGGSQPVPADATVADIRRMAQDQGWTYSLRQGLLERTARDDAERREQRR